MSDINTTLLILILLLMPVHRENRIKVGLFYAFIATVLYFAILVIRSI